MKSIALNSLVLCLLILPACRFKVPNPEEQKELLARGTFPGAVPAWVSAQKGSRNQSLSAVVPSVFSAPIHSAPLFESASAASDPRDLNAAEQEKSVQKSGAKAKKSISSDITEAGAFLRVVIQCPEIEEETKAALINTEPYSRMEQYRVLSERCPESADLWFWRGKDYLAEGRLIDARNCFENAVLRNRSLEHARSLFEAVDAQLNSKK